MDNQSMLYFGHVRARKRIDDPHHLILKRAHRRRFVTGYQCYGPGVVH
jgi:hypothetical protein